MIRMQKRNHTANIFDNPDHLIRPRVNELLSKAIEKPLVIVCAGAGYGKTRAVYDFTKKKAVSTLCGCSFRSLTI